MRLGILGIQPDGGFKFGAGFGKLLLGAIDDAEEIMGLVGFGVVNLLLGVVGEYLALIYEEVKQRPNFIVTRKVGV